MSYANSYVSSPDGPTNGDYEGDIKLTASQRNLIEQTAIDPMTAANADPFGPQNAVTRFEQNRWPNGVVPYEFDSAVGSE